MSTQVWSKSTSSNGSFFTKIFNKKIGILVVFLDSVFSGLISTSPFDYFSEPFYISTNGLTLWFNGFYSTKIPIPFPLFMLGRVSFALGTSLCSLFPMLYCCQLQNLLDYLIEVLQVKKYWQSCRRCFKLPQKWHLIEYFSKSTTTFMFSLFNLSKPIVATHPCIGSIIRQNSRSCFFVIVTIFSKNSPHSNNSFCFQCFVFQWEHFESAPNKDLQRLWEFKIETKHSLLVNWSTPWCTMWSQHQSGGRLYI